jgi:hypothetical protein
LCRRIFYWKRSNRLLAPIMASDAENGCRFAVPPNQVPALLLTIFGDNWHQMSWEYADNWRYKICGRMSPL